MSEEKLIYTLFTESNNIEGDIVEVFDFYDSSYGNIFHEGELISDFYKKPYYDVLSNYSTIKKLEKSKVDINTAQVVIYDLYPFRDYQHLMSITEFEIADEYSYEQLFYCMKQDLAVIKQCAIDEKKNDRYFKFIEIKPLSSFLD